MARPAVFLDRDDTLIPNASLPDRAFAGRRGDLADPDYVVLLPGVLDACRELRDAGFVLVVVSNQGVVARGGATVDQVERAMAKLDQLLTVGGVSLVERVYFCPHHPEGVVEPWNIEHPTRKPGPGMLVQARDDLGLDLARSWTIGDKHRDIEAGENAGLSPERCLRIGPSAPFPDLPQAASHILSNL